MDEEPPSHLFIAVKHIGTHVAKSQKKSGFIVQRAREFCSALRAQIARTMRCSDAVAWAGSAPSGGGGHPPL